MTKKRKVLIIIFALVFITGSVLGFLYFNKDHEKVVVIKQEDIIKDYNYTIKETDSKLKKDLFNELKEILSSENVDFDNYAKKLAEIFTVDVYDLNSKINKYDVGGLEYILEEKKEVFKQVLQDSLYSNIKDNSNNNRNQKLPVVKKVTAQDLKTDNYSYNGNKYDSYIINVVIDYEKDLGYDKDISVEMIKKDNKLFVVKVGPN